MPDTYRFSWLWKSEMNYNLAFKRQGGWRKHLLESAWIFLFEAAYDGEI